MTESMSIEDFNANFSVSVLEYKEDALANTVTVYFGVVCNLNSRKSVWTPSVDTTLLPEGYTPQDVLDTAWDEIKNTVNDWAQVNIVEGPYHIFTPQTTNDAISLTTFNNNFTVYFSRFELYPSVQPTSWCIGFRVVMNNNGASMYCDATVPVADHCNNTVCMSIATSVWDILKPQVCNWAAGEVAKSSVLNTTYVPSALVL